MSEEIIRKILPWVIAVINPIFMGLNSIIIKKAFNDGMKYSVLLFYKNTLVAIGGLLILLFSRKSRSKITLQILPKIVALSILETGVDQNFLYLGMRYTPASLATCIIATTPILTFVVGLLFKYIRNRNERPIDIKERSTRAKLLGLAIVVGGAFVVGLYNGPAITTRSYINNNKEVIAHKLRENLVRGPILIILAVIAVSIYNNLLKNTLPRAPLLLTTLTCSIGALINMVVAIALEGKSGASWMLGLNSKLLCYLYSGLVVSGLVSMLQNIGTNMKDAVSIAIFNPTSMIYVMVLSATWLKETIHLGSGLGAGVIIIGLSFYIWGVKHEPAVEES